MICTDLVQLLLRALGLTGSLSDGLWLISSVYVVTWLNFLDLSKNPIGFLLSFFFFFSPVKYRKLVKRREKKNGPSLLYDTYSVREDKTELSVS